jgi:hypothetical protein
MRELFQIIEITSNIVNIKNKHTWRNYHVNIDEFDKCNLPIQQGIYITAEVNPNNQGDTVILKDFRLIEQEVDYKFIAHCIQNKLFPISIYQAHISALPTNEAVSIAENLADLVIVNNIRQDFIATLPTNLLMASPKLRGLIAPETLLSIYTNIIILNQDFLSTDTENEIARSVRLAGQQAAQMFVEGLPKELAFQHKWIRALLPYDKTITIYSEMLCQPELLVNNNDIENEAARIIKKMRHNTDEKIFNYIPLDIFYRSRLLRSALPNHLYLVVCIGLLNDDLPKKDSVIEEIISILDQTNSEELDTLMRSIPEHIMRSQQQVRNKLPLEQRFAINLVMWEETGFKDTLLRDEVLVTINLNDTISDSLWARIPHAAYDTDPTLRKRLPIKILISYLVGAIEKASLDSKRLLKKELLDALSNFTDTDVWYMVPDTFILEDGFWSIAPYTRVCQQISHQFSSAVEHQSQHILQIVDYILSNSPANEHLSIIMKLPFWIQRHQMYINLLPSVEQVNAVWPKFEAGDYSLWTRLSDEARHLCVYRSVKEGLKLPIKSLEEQHSITKGLLTILWARTKPTKHTEAFQRAHAFLQDYVLEQAWTSSAPLLLDTLLPYCRPGKVRYCEVRPWPLPEHKEGQLFTRTFCPRVRSSCGQFIPSQDTYHKGTLTGARLYADCNQSWEDWSLLELLEATGVIPVLHQLNRPEDYVPKLAAWINRLNELRQRLRCSHCDQIMIPNMRYAKFLAKFGMTVASCGKGEPHDTNVYFNECWACDGIIDSRENKVSVEKYYLCLKCSSGPQSSSIYTQGSLCPKCGSTQLSRQTERHYVCQNEICKHEFTVPEKRKLTGPGYVDEPAHSN